MFDKIKAACTTQNLLIVCAVAILVAAVWFVYTKWFKGKKTEDNKNPPVTSGNSNPGNSNPGNNNPGNNNPPESRENP